MNYTFLDLFAGAGGASNGLERAGFKAIGAIEIDDWAADTYEFNHPNVKVLREDITNVNDKMLSQFKGVDLIIGGPPCQGFSIAASNRRDSNDPRNQLYRHYIRAVDKIRPKFFIVENVKELAKFKMEDSSLLLDDFVKRLEDLGYKVSYDLLNAKDFGAPQDRIRFFMIGALSEEIDIKAIEQYKKPQRTLWDAISDLPVPKVGVDTMSYSKVADNDYQKISRKDSEFVFNHEPMRHTQRVIERFKLIPINGNTQNVPIEHRNRKRGKVEELSTKVYHQNHRRLNPDQPCKTITASFYSSFVHPYQHRNLTVREAARVQGFPDKFKFLGKRTTLSKKLLEKKGIFGDIHLDQFNQVGNAVSPLVAEALGQLILNKLK
nr:DNA cytosine methyltransferase [uncultured Allomuricauda sp.]